MSRAPAVELWLGADFESNWQAVLLPWLSGAGREAMFSSLPTAVVVPHRAHAVQLRHRLLDEKMSLPGVRFFTPPLLRERLLRGADERPPLREHLRFLLGVAAAQIAEGTSDDDHRKIAQAVSFAPDDLLRAIDELSASGWISAVFGTSATRKIADRFHALRTRCGFPLVHDVDRVAAERAPESAAIFRAVLLTGFTGAAWPQWHLLRATVNAAERATVLLPNPQDEAGELDRVWVGSWEETFGSAEPVPAVAAATSPRLEFAVGYDATEQAEIIASHALRFVAERADASVAIVLPASGALQRSIERALASRGVHYNDGIGHSAAPPGDHGAWSAWLRFQENPGVRPLLRFLRVCDAALAPFAGLPWREIDDALRAAYRDLLLDDLRVLEAHIVGKRNGDRLARGLAGVERLPATARLERYLERAIAIADSLGWRDRAAHLRTLNAAWCSALAAPLNRNAFLRWLGEVTATSERERDAAGAHPYARVQLFRYADAMIGDWSAVILGGLNDGVWPVPNSDSGFLIADERRALNAKAARTGGQGAGHRTVEPGKALLITAADERQIAWRDVRNLIGSARDHVVLTAHLMGDTAPTRAAHPSEIFSRIYTEVRETPISRPRLEALQRSTRAIIPAREDSEPSPDVAATTRAFIARRDPGQAAGEYECTLREPPREPLVLNVTDWRQVLNSPPLIWFREFLGVEADEEAEVNWNLATGIWAHHWLAAILPSDGRDNLRALPDRDEILRRVRVAAATSKAEIENLVAAAGATLPDWWLSGWRGAELTAQRLARRLIERDERWQFGVTESRITRDEAITLPGDKSLRVHGRIDLILATSDDATAPRWALDYKTGNATPLSRKNLLKELRRGNAVQICLYGFALGSRGASDVSVSLLTRTSAAEPQVEVGDAADDVAFWTTIAEMAETGRFGLGADRRSEFGFSGTYPIATLPIDIDVLQEKWQRTHPALAL